MKIRMMIGMKIRSTVLALVLAFAFLLALPLSAQFGVAVSVRSGTADPATCSASGINIFFNRTSGLLKICPAGTWVSVGPAASPTTVANGGTGVTSLTAYAPVFGGTTSTGAVQSGTVGTAGQILTSNGAGALPTFQAAGSAGANTALSNLASVAINTSLLPGTDADLAAGLGSTTKRFPFLYLPVNSFTGLGRIHFYDESGPYDNRLSWSGGLLIRDAEHGGALTLVVSDTASVTGPSVDGVMTVQGNDTTGSGAIVLDTSPTIATPALTTPTLNGVKVASSAKSANYTLTATDFVVTVDASGGVVTLTLPAASVGRLTYRIKKIDASANAVTIARAGADTIDGATSTSLTSQWESKDIVGLTSSTWGIF